MYTGKEKAQSAAEYAAERAKEEVCRSMLHLEVLSRAVISSPFLSTTEEGLPEHVCSTSRRFRAACCHLAPA